jgi:hypothetical protein
MKIIYYLTAIVVLYSLKVDAQSTNPGNYHVQKGVQSLDVGDQMPVMRIEDIYNADRSSASTADFNRQLLILDFGNTHCSGCIEALPHIDSLQRQFKGSVKIFWVTDETKPVVAAFWKQNPLTRQLSVSTICADSILAALFPHKIWPHEVWIYQGKVIAITGSDHVDSPSIQQVLDNKPVNWPVRNDFYRDQEWLKNEKHFYGVKETPSGLLYQIYSMGTGAMPKPNSIVKLKYKLMNFDLEVIEDHTSIPQEDHLDNLLTGIQEAVKMMPAGSKWLVWMPTGLCTDKKGKVGGGRALTAYLQILDVK